MNEPQTKKLYQRLKEKGFLSLDKDVNDKPVEERVEAFLNDYQTKQRKMQKEIRQVLGKLKDLLDSA